MVTVAYPMTIKLATFEVTDETVLPATCPFEFNEILGEERRQ